jgi:hypothetical protein
MDRLESKTDWNRVLACKYGDHIPYEPEDGPYDPNDADAARIWLSQAKVIHKGKVVQHGKHDLQD